MFKKNSKSSIAGIFLSLALATLSRHSNAHTDDLRWAVDYSASGSPSAMLDYDVLVLDADRHPPLDALVETGKSVLGYLSLGEVNDSRHYFSGLKTHGVLLGGNDNWPGSYRIDVRSRIWSKMVLETLIPDLLRQGFSGVFIDTVDTAVYLEQSEPIRHLGMRNAAVELILAIRANYPGITIMLNRGYDILPLVGSSVDIVLGESVYSTYDFSSKTYRRVVEADYHFQRELLRKAKANNPALQVFTLDYWDPSDERGVAEIYELQRRNGFSPYVSVISLDRILTEPGR